jgi:serine protease Do
MTIPGFGEIAESLRRSTVLIHAGPRGNGSGVIWTSDGIIITNAHVARASALRVQLWDGREFATEIMSRDTRRDLALLHINAEDLPAAMAVDSSKVRAGELVIAVGNPMGFVGALTTGVIHAVGPLPVRGLGGQSWVQASVRLAPGHSGGPLADARGRVIGINTMVAGRVALAVPSNTVRQFASAGSSDGWLGVSVHPVRVPQRSGHRFGLVLLEVEPGSPAARASLLPGDILLGADDRAFAALEDLAEIVEDTGQRTARFEFLRGDYSRIRRVTVQLGASRGKATIAA